MSAWILRVCVAALVSTLSLAAHANTIFVNIAATGLNTGESWSDAFISLQDAIRISSAGDEIWVAEGRYVPTLKDDRYATFRIPDGVACYGGFNGTEGDRFQRNWVSHSTVLSGDIGAPGRHADNVFHIVEPESLAVSAD